jgi:hypothetical protein
MSADNAALAHCFRGEIFSQDRLNVVDEIVARDFAWHSTGRPPELANRDGLKQFASMLRAAFPELHADERGHDRRRRQGRHPLDAPRPTRG